MGLFHLTNYSPSLREVRAENTTQELNRSRQNLPEAMEEHGLLTPHCFLSLLFHNFEDHSPSGQPTVINQENVP